VTIPEGQSQAITPVSNESRALPGPKNHVTTWLLSSIRSSQELRPKLLQPKWKHDAQHELMVIADHPDIGAGRLTPMFLLVTGLPR
jgi:hypothetical protein